MNLKRIILIFFLTLLFFSLNITFTNANTTLDVDETVFLPDCGGLLPENYEYIEFLIKTSESFIAENKKKSDNIAKKIFILVSLRNSSIFDIQDQLAISTQQDIDKMIADEMCAFAKGKDKNDLWNGSQILKDWVKKNIDDLIAQVENIIKLALELRGELRMSEEQVLMRKKKLSRIKAQGKIRARKLIKKLEKKK